MTNRMTPSVCNKLQATPLSAKGFYLIYPTYYGWWFIYNYEREDKNKEQDIGHVCKPFRKRLNNFGLTTDNSCRSCNVKFPKFIKRLKFLICLAGHETSKEMTSIRCQK